MPSKAGAVAGSHVGSIPEGPEMPRLAATEGLAPRPGMPGNPAMLPRAIVCPKVCSSTRPYVRQ